MRTSPVMAVVGGTHFPVKRDTIAQICPNPPPFSTNSTLKETAYHSDTCTRPVLLLRTRRKVQMQVHRGIWYA